MSLIVNGTEIENVIVIQRATGESTEIEKLQDQNGNVIWEKQTAPLFQIMPIGATSYANAYTYVSSGTYSSGNYYRYNKDTYSYDPVTLAEGDSVAGLYKDPITTVGNIVGYAVGDGTNSCNIFSQTSFNIPKSFNGLPIMKISNNAFLNETIGNISWGENMRLIERKAFDGSNIYNNASNWENNCLKVNNAYVVVKADATTITIPEYIEILGVGMCYDRPPTPLTVYYNSNKIKNLTSSGAFKSNKSGSIVGNSQIIFGSNVTRIPSYLFVSGHDSGSSASGTQVLDTFKLDSLPNTITTLEPFALFSNWNGASNHPVFQNTASSPFVIPSTITNIADSAGQSSVITYLRVDTTRISKKMFYQGTYALLEEVTIGANCTEIGEQAFGGASALKKLTFEQPNNISVVFPTAGSSTGAFYYKSARTVSIYTDNESVKNHDWATDNITATFYHLDGTAWA